jgi:hypothetical protein
LPTIHSSVVWNSSSGVRPTTSSGRSTPRGETTTEATALRSPLDAVSVCARPFGDERAVGLDHRAITCH